MRFTIRDLLWLTLVVAMGVTWTIDHRSLRRQIQEGDPATRDFKAMILEQLLEERGVTVYVPRAGEIEITENGKTTTRSYSW